MHTLTRFNHVCVVVITLVMLTGCPAPRPATPAPSSEAQQKLSLCLKMDGLLIGNQSAFSGLSAGDGYLAEVGVRTEIQYKQLQSDDLRSLVIVTMACREHAVGLLSEEEYQSDIREALAPEAAIEAKYDSLMADMQSKFSNFATVPKILKAAAIDQADIFVPPPVTNSQAAAIVQQQAVDALLAADGRNHDEINGKLDALSAQISQLQFLETASLKGCLSTGREQKGDSIDIQFAAGSNLLSAEAVGLLTKVPSYTLGATIDIAGYADHTGNWRVNEMLSDSRARAVREWLQLHKNYPIAAVCNTGYGNQFVDKRMATVTLYQG